MTNLEIYEKSRTVPKEAKKSIAGGKLKGKTDINPMWRIKKLTELFGPCGVGWYIEPVKEEIRELKSGEVAFLMDINLYVKIDGEWSKPIFGTGGSMLNQIERGNLVANDEGKKMAYTDAISVACKALGFAADVYFERDASSKYNAQADENQQAVSKPQSAPPQDAQSAEAQKEVYYKDKNKQLLRAIEQKSGADTHSLNAEYHRRIAALGDNGKSAFHVNTMLTTWLQELQQ